MKKNTQPRNIPVQALSDFANRYGYDHIIVFATGPERMEYVATWGRTIQECDQAAQFGDKLKDGLGWPESLHAMPSRVRALQKRIKELEKQLESIPARRPKPPEPDRGQS